MCPEGEVQEKPEKRSVKELMEFIQGTGKITVTGLAVAHEGLGVDDVPKVLDLAKNYETLVEAYSDLDEIDDEVKDLDEAELVAIVAAVYGVYKASRKALKTGVVDY